MKDVAQYTRVTPNQRLNSLRQYLNNVRKSEEAQRVLREWGLRIDNDVIDLKGRQLESETICFGNNATFQSHNADWNRAAGENKVTGPVDIFNWVLFYTQRDSKNAQEFAQMMCRLGGVLGCQIKQPTPVRLQDDRNETYMEACKTHINKHTQVSFSLFVDKHFCSYPNSTYYIFSEYSPCNIGIFLESGK